MRAPAGWLFAATIVSACCLSACPAPRRPTQPAGAFTLEIGRDGGSLHGIAGDADHSYAALTTRGQTTSAQTTIEARRGSQLVWKTELAGEGGPLARTPTLVIAAVLGGSAAGVTLRGEPGAVVVGLDPRTGVARWKLAVDSSEWALVAAIAAAGEDVIVGGSFAGTLRAGAKTVSSAGKSDGFVARITATGEVVWIVRLGGPGADAVAGVASTGSRVVIAGTFAAGADLLGEPFAAYDERTPRADGFVAELDGAGARRWSTTFGGRMDDSVAGVAIDGAGRIAVAANTREVVKIAAGEVIAMGDGDGAIAWWSKDGVPGPIVQLGGPEFDGVRAITAAGDRVVVAGFFSGTMRLGERILTAGGGDDAFVVAYENGAFVELWPITGEGREEVAALAGIPGGFIAGVTHTARATIGGADVAAPRDPTSGAALVVRAVP
ncbi:MAG: hypothetical protein H0T89_18845 [Deltaproteobacteria bacterium]|nr:hypothetical protein [Deltaproteobacteria bacterium]MDQ3296906.1 hypothetical protein [Myxococcota bacterium]